jgi:hypothetical protein
MRLDRFRIHREKPSDVEFRAKLKPANEVLHLELSIHEICHYRVGPALRTYRGDLDDLDEPDLNDSKPLRWPLDILGITFDKNCKIQMKLLAMEFDDHRMAELLNLRHGIHAGLS